MNRARIVLLDRALSPSENRRAEAQRAADPRIAAALDHTTRAGFAEYLAAAPAILNRWLSARNGQNPTAGAIIAAAVDARRAGYLSPLSRGLLNELHIHYLDPRQALAIPWNRRDFRFSDVACAPRARRGRLGLPAFPGPRVRRGSGVKAGPKGRRVSDAQQP